MANNISNKIVKTTKVIYNTSIIIVAHSTVTSTVHILQRAFQNNYPELKEKAEGDCENWEGTLILKIKKCGGTNGHYYRLFFIIDFTIGSKNLRWHVAPCHTHLPSMPGG